MQRLVFTRLNKGGRGVVKRARIKCVIFAQIERAELGSAYLGRIREYGLEDRFELARRRADDLEHVGGGGLLLQRLAQLAEQPRVLDGDNGLRCEILHQFNLLFRKREHLPAIDDDQADMLAFPEHRNEQQGTYTGNFDAGDGERVTFQVGRVGAHVRDLDRFATRGSPRHGTVGAGAVDRATAPLLDPDRRQVAVRCDSPVAIAFVQPQRAVAGFAKLGRLRQHRAEYRIERARRTGDHLEHIGGRGLLLQRLAQLAEQPRVLDGDHALGGKVLDQLDLLVGKGTHLLPVDRHRTEQFVFLQHRDDQLCASAAKISKFDDGLIALKIWFFGPDILDVHDLLCPGDTGKTAVWMRIKFLTQAHSELRRRIVEGNAPIDAVLV